MPKLNYIDIAVGVLKKGNNVCLSLRQKHQTHANHWEFPGGKIESEETVHEALKREFLEELAIETYDWKPLIEIPWQYEKVAVRLYVYITESFLGEPTGNEGQKVQWFTMDELAGLSFPEANKGILRALQLADKYMISGSFSGKEEALQKFAQAINLGIEFCQLRAKELSSEAFKAIALPVIEQVHNVNKVNNIEIIETLERNGAKILLNGSVDLLNAFPNADGIQLASNAIYQFNERPISKNKLLGVSTHTDEDIKQALKIGADFILLSPVKETSSHPGVPGIGWDEFARKVKSIPIPVYALGGMKPDDIDTAIERGAQGIAAISGFWPD